MKQNIAIALATVVALLAGVFAGGVTMSVGMLVHEASVLVVILNAMRLMRNDGNSTAMAKELRSPSRREGVKATEDSTSVGA
jgi:Cd2+/Zn2+-exporting ATPase